MNISLNSFRTNEDDITTFFTLTDDADYKWHADIPVMEEADIQSCLEANIDLYRCGIYRKQYREGKPESLTIEAWKSWEAAGCRNVTITPLPEVNADISEVDDPAQGQEPTVSTTEVIIQKAKWRNTH